MEALLTQDEQDVRLKGKSRKSEGLVFPEFSKQHVVEPFKIPNDWTRFMALDPGYRTFAVLWAAVDPGDKIYIYHELYLHAKHYSEVANAIFAANGYKFVEDLKKFVWDEGKSVAMETTWIDPSTFGHFDSGELKTGNLLANYGLHCVPAQNDVEAGIQVVRRALMPDLDEVPRLRIFRSCENLLKEMRNYRRHKETRDTGRNQRTEAPIKRNDHTLDCLRYLFLGGLYYRKPLDPWLVREKREESERMPQIQGSKTHEMLLREEWRQLMRNQKQDNTVPASTHLGSEF
jgi:phage terminase large subunit